MAPVIHNLGKPHSCKHYSLEDILSSMGPFNAPYLQFYQAFSHQISHVPLQLSCADL